MGAKEKFIKELAEEGEETLPSKAAGAFGKSRRSIDSIRLDQLNRLEEAVAASKSEAEQIALKRKQKEIELAYREMANLPKEEQEVVANAIEKSLVPVFQKQEESGFRLGARTGESFREPVITASPYSTALVPKQQSSLSRLQGDVIDVKKVEPIRGTPGSGKDLAMALGAGAAVLGAGAGIASQFTGGDETSPSPVGRRAEIRTADGKSLADISTLGQIRADEAFKRLNIPTVPEAPADDTATPLQAGVTNGKISPEALTRTGEADRYNRQLASFAEEFDALDKNAPDFEAKKAAFVSRLKAAGLTPQQWMSEFSKMGGTLKPRPQEPEVVQPDIPAKPAGEETEVPKGPADLAKLFEDARNNYETLYGEHGKALASEAEALKGDMERARQLYQESVAKAESRYEKEKAMAQWGQIAETIGRSLISLVAARNSLKKGRDFTQGLDPRAQVDWMGQLQEARSTLGRDLDQANKLLSLDREQAETGYKGRVGEQQAIFEGKRESARALMDELRAMRSEQAAEGRQAKRDEKSLRAELDREQRAADARQEQLINATTADRIKEVNKVYSEIGREIPNLFATGKGASDTIKKAEDTIRNSLIKQGVPAAKIDATLERAKSKGMLWWKSYGPEAQSLIMSDLGMVLKPAYRPTIRAEVEQEITGKGAPVEVRTKEDYDKLPSGTKFTWVYPDGRTKTGTK